MIWYGTSTFFETIHSFMKSWSTQVGCYYYRNKIATWAYKQTWKVEINERKLTWVADARVYIKVYELWKTELPAMDWWEKNGQGDSNTPESMRVSTQLQSPSKLLLCIFSSKGEKWRTCNSSVEQVKQRQNCRAISLSTTRIEKNGQGGSDNIASKYTTKPNHRNCCCNFFHQKLKMKRLQLVNLTSGTRAVEYIGCLHDGFHRGTVVWDKPSCIVI